MTLIKHYAPLMIPLVLHEEPTQPEFHCYVASDADARIAALTEALRNVLAIVRESHGARHRPGSHIAIESLCNAALAQPQAVQRQFRYMNCNGGPIDPLELCSVCNGVGVHNQIHNPDYKP